MHLTIAKEFAALGEKAEASRLLVHALVSAKKIEEGQEGMTWWSQELLEKIAREQVKLGERERAGETLELISGWVNRAKKNEFIGNGRLRAVRNPSRDEVFRRGRAELRSTLDRGERE